MAEGRKVVRRGGSGLLYDVLAEVDGYLWVRYDTNAPTSGRVEDFKPYNEFPYPVGTRLVWRFSNTSSYEYLGPFGSGDDPHRHAIRYEEDGRVYETTALSLYREADQPV